MKTFMVPMFLIISGESEEHIFNSIVDAQVAVRNATLGFLYQDEELPVAVVPADEEHHTLIDHCYYNHPESTHNQGA